MHFFMSCCMCTQNFLLFSPIVLIKVCQMHGHTHVYHHIVPSTFQQGGIRILILKSPSTALFILVLETTTMSNTTWRLSQQHFFVNHNCHWTDYTDCTCDHTHARTHAQTHISHEPLHWRLWTKPNKSMFGTSALHVDQAYQLSLHSIKNIQIHFKQFTPWTWHHRPTSCMEDPLHQFHTSFERVMKSGMLKSKQFLHKWCNIRLTSACLLTTVI